MAELLDKVSSRELSEWILYARDNGPLDPFARGDIRAGIIAATISNLNRRKGRKAAKPSDFMPTWNRTTKIRQSSDKVIRQRLDTIFKGMGGQ